jgi:uncharacterized membrane protein
MDTIMSFMVLLLVTTILTLCCITMLQVVFEDKDIFKKSILRVLGYGVLIVLGFTVLVLAVCVIREVF